MSLSKRLWEANQDLARASLEHPFVQGLADGTLSRERFAYYLGQDAFYLRAFARAYSIAAAKAPDWEGFRAFHELAGGTLEELCLHQGYAERWGVDLYAVEPAPTTRRYTDFLLATAWGHDAGMTATAMTPCGRLYAYVGQELARGGIPDHAYADWIRTYSASEVEALVQHQEALVDRYVTDISLAHATYRYAMLCERDFFVAAWNSIVQTSSE